MALDFLPGLPQVPEPQELGLLLILGAAETGVGLVGGGLTLGRALAHVLGGQGGSDHQHLGQAAPVAGGEDHAADLRIQGQLGQLAADGGEVHGRRPLHLLHRTQLGQ